MLQSTSLVFPLHDQLSIAECCYSFRLLYLHLSLFMESKSSVLLVLVFPSTSVFWYIRCHKFWDWCISCPGKDSPCQVGPGVPSAQLLKSVPLDNSGHKCWSIKYLPIFLSPVKLSRWNTSCCFTSHMWMKPHYIMRALLWDKFRQAIHFMTHVIKGITCTVYSD